MALTRLCLTSEGKMSKLGHRHPSAQPDDVGHYVWPAYIVLGDSEQHVTRAADCVHVTTVSLAASLLLRFGSLRLEIGVADGLFVMTTVVSTRAAGYSSVARQVLQQSFESLLGVFPHLKELELPRACLLMQLQSSCHVFLLIATIAGAVAQ